MESQYHNIMKGLTSHFAAKMCHNLSLFDQPPPPQVSDILFDKLLILLWLWRFYFDFIWIFEHFEYFKSYDLSTTTEVQDMIKGTRYRTLRDFTLGLYFIFVKTESDRFLSAEVLILLKNKKYSYRLLLL